MSKVIFSNDFDHTTNEVMDWVKYLGDEVEIINNFDKATYSVQIENTLDVNAFLNNITITKAWFRKNSKFSDIIWASQN